MEKKELLEYLAAVCDGEAAKYACEEAIRKLNERLSFPDDDEEQTVPVIAFPIEPSKPSREQFAPRIPSPKKSDFTGLGCGLGLIIGSGIFLWVALHNFTEFLKNPLSLFGTACFISLVVYFVCRGIEGILNAHRQSEYETNRAATMETKYAQAMRDYRQRMDEYHRKYAIAEGKRATVLHLIEGYKTTQDEIEVKLNLLYEQEVIYPRFRNIIAVNQIREYLEMGVCDELEGTDGAYAQYLQDIRTEKICGSIRELQRALERSMNQLALIQSRLLYEVQKTNAHLQTLNDTINTELNGIRSQLDGLSHSLPVLNTHVSELSTHAQHIQQAVRTSAYNDYIIQRITHMDDYTARMLLKAPKL